MGWMSPTRPSVTHSTCARNARNWATTAQETIIGETADLYCGLVLIYCYELNKMFLESVVESASVMLDLVGEQRIAFLV